MTKTAGFRRQVTDLSLQKNLDYFYEAAGDGSVIVVEKEYSVYAGRIDKRQARLERLLQLTEIRHRE